MYESFFGLAKRPFTAMPDPACFVPIDGIYQAYSSLAQCVDRRAGNRRADRAGRAWARRSFASGSPANWKTASPSFFCRHQFPHAAVAAAGHPVRAGPFLCPHGRPGAAARVDLRDPSASARPRNDRPDRRRGPSVGACACWKSCDTLTNFADAGESLVRLVISGQLSLEETLSQPSLHAFNQRIGIQTTLESLTRDESAEYVSRRLALAGANVTDVLTNDALATICEASDGSPRCLNQLCDHSLLLGYLASQKPVSSPDCARSARRPETTAV